MNPDRGWGAMGATAAGAVLAGLVLGPLALVSMALTGAVIASVIIVVAVYRRPQYGAYILLFSTPLVLGINRGAVLPSLRLSEAVLGVVAVALLARSIADLARRGRHAIDPSRFEIALVIMVWVGSVLPLAWMAARAIRPQPDDVLHALVFWKYLALYVVMKLSLKSAAQIRNCLWIVLGVNALVGSIAVLQAMRLFGVDRLMARFYPPPQSALGALNGRGTATLASSIAVGDVMAISLGLALAMLLLGRGPRPLLVALVALFALGGIGSGQFSGTIALLVVVFAVGYVTRRLGRLSFTLVPGLGVAMILLAPVVMGRLSGFASESGVPSSWEGRWDNLTNHVWPRITSGYDFIFGVQSSPRIPAWESWRDWIFIESGHLWLVWVGGIPLLVAFLYYSWVALTSTASVARSRTDIVGVAAIGAFAGLWVVLVLTTFDAHLLLRGSADLLFPLLAMAFAKLPPEPPARELEPLSASFQGGGRLE